MTRVNIFILISMVTLHQSSSWQDGVLDEERLAKFYQEFYRIPELDKTRVVQMESTGPQPAVQTSSGVIYGITTDYDHSFYGIRYAEPPTGPLRFQPPVPYNGTGAKHNKTSQDGLSCYQIVTNINRDEDCLILDVHVPKGVDLSDPDKPPHDRLPVLFSIHGGGFIIGAGTWAIYEGHFLSEVTDTIVVSINYRLGAFGFLVLKDGENDLPGNQGIKDQQIAMQWVQDNIQKFGGDKDRVTIFGESAGAQSAMLHLLSDVSDGLFQNAILQSNLLANHYHTREEALNATTKIVKFLRCGKLDATLDRKCCKLMKSDYECLIEADPQQITNAMMSLKAQALTELDYFNFVEPVHPFIDGVEFSEQPINLFKKGKWQTKKPFISGTNEEELITVKYLFDWLIQNESIYRGINEIMFRGHGIYNDTGDRISDKYIETYGYESDGDDWAWLMAQQATDIVFGCAQRILARYASATAESGVYYYQFHHWLDDENCTSEKCGSSAHGSEVAYVYRTIEYLNMVADEGDEFVMDEFSTYWGGLARTRDPNGGLETSLGDFPTWPKYEALIAEGSPGPWVNIRIAPQTHLESDYRKDMCDFLDSLGLYTEVENPPTEPTDSTVEATTPGKIKATTPTLVEETTSGASNLATNLKLVIPSAAAYFTARLFY